MHGREGESNISFYVAHSTSIIYNSAKLKEISDLSEGRGVCQIGKEKFLL